MLRVLTFCLLQHTRKLAHYFESAGQQDKFKTLSQFCVSRRWSKQKAIRLVKVSLVAKYISNASIFFVKLISKTIILVSRMFKLDLIIVAPLQMKTDCATKLSFCFFHYVTMPQWQKFPNIVQKVLFKDFILYAHENEGAWVWVQL